MGSRLGFEYRYRFRVDDEIIPQYTWNVDRHTRFLCETRTNFIVKRQFDDEIVIDSEIYATAVVAENFSFCEVSFSRVGSRLKDYWMRDDEIEEFIHHASAFANHCSPKPQHDQIAICIDFDVCTVQQQGEPIDATMDRAIRTEYLYPLSLCLAYHISPQKTCPAEIENSEVFLMLFLREELPTSTIRVEDFDEGLSLMEVCPICLRNPTVGSQISFLGCGHVFHNHCIIRWLQDKNSCPMCRRQAHNAFTDEYINNKLMSM